MQFPDLKTIYESPDKNIVEIMQQARRVNEVRNQITRAFCELISASRLEFYTEMHKRFPELKHIVRQDNPLRLKFIFKNGDNAFTIDIYQKEDLA